MMPSKRTEATLQNEIVRYLRWRGFEAGKVKVGGIQRHGRFCFDGYLFRGVADVLSFLPFCVWWEVKLKTSQSQEQKTFQELCKKANIFYYVVHSVEEVDKILLDEFSLPAKKST